MELLTNLMLRISLILLLKNLIIKPCFTEQKILFKEICYEEFNSKIITFETMNANEIIF